MPNYTDNLELFKYDVEADKKSTFNIGLALNDNFDKIDAKVGEMETQQANIDLSNLSTTGNSKLNAKANIDLSNLSTTGEKRFEDINTQIAKTVLQSDLYDSNGHIKIDKMNFPQITRTYVNGKSWYCLYSNKWCLQGGYITLGGNKQGTITYSKPFANADYTVTFAPIVNSTYSGGMDYLGLGSLTANQLIINNGHSSSMSFFWCAIGFIA